MSKDKTGGPIFPVYGTDADDHQYIEEEGMTVRDYFAAKAMHAQLVDSGASDEAKKQGARLFAEDVANISYFIADAMLKEREK
jgi:hypothetical protein